MTKRLQKLVNNVLSIPTAPYHENQVIRFVRAFANRRRIPIKEDRYGNLLVRYRRGKAKPIAITAHMDHPGFSVESFDGQKVLARWSGGCDPNHFPGSRVIIRSKRDLLPGRIVSSLSKNRQFEIKLSRKADIDEDAFGYFDLVPCEFRDDRIYTKAADNLINCAVLLAVLDELNRRKLDADFRAVFTRAEEVGLAGATGLIRTKAIPKTVPIVVLEASKELPGAIMGSGPVLRVGDYLSVFDARLDYGMHQTARRVAQSNRAFAYQRQLMSGGACEATLYAIHNRPVGALAIPLGNYHNQGKHRPAPEYVSAFDVSNMVTLCHALASAPPPSEPRIALRRDFDKQFTRRHERRLLDTKLPT